MGLKGQTEATTKGHTRAGGTSEELDVSIDLGSIDDLTTDQRRRMLEQVHHEIRTPLAALLGHLELVEEADVELPYRLEISLAAVNRAGDRLRALLAEMDEQVSVPSLG